MTIKYLILSTVLTITLTLPMFGQPNYTNISKSVMLKMLGKPTVEVTVDGYYMKVWLMTQQQHKKISEKMKMDKPMKDPMIDGTHHIMLDLKDIESGKEIAYATANVLIVSPSMKNLLVDLIPVMNHFGSAITLDEKGEYNLKVSVIVGGITRSTQFKYVIE